MARYKMKYKVYHLVYFVIYKYLNELERDNLYNALSKYVKPEQHFFKILPTYFDYEKLRISPLLWQDIWIYNFLQYYQTKKDFKLVEKYEKEVILTNPDTIIDLDKLIYSLKSIEIAGQIKSETLNQPIIKYTPPNKLLRD